MSFLNSVLSSIGGGGEYVPPSTPRTPAPTLPTPATQPVPCTSKPNGVFTREGGAGQGQKRKAEEQLPGPYNKLSRRDAPVPTTAHPKASTTNLPPKIASIKASATSSAGQYGGTAKASNATPIPATASDKAAPKKGSYAEILARAKAAQTASAHVGVIKHKPKETLSKRERLALQAEASGKSKSKTKPSAINGRRNTPDSKGSSPAPSTIPGRNRDIASLKSKNKAPEAGYKGTARPLPETSYKGTMNRSSTGISSTVRRKHTDDCTYDRSRSTSVTRPITKSRRYADYSDEDDEDEDLDEEEEEEEANYESDLSDMEAGAFDVEEEEQLSSKVARREDEEELRKEVELKRQKEAMRRKLTQMAAARRRG